MLCLILRILNPREADSMRLFGYYAWHSFVNQLRKLFKTWVLIFLVVCMAIGALIGFGAATLEDAAGGDEEIVENRSILPAYIFISIFLIFLKS